MQIFSEKGSWTGQLRTLVFAGIALISLAMHLPHFGKELVSIHVWRQAQTQSTILNFYEGDMNILNPQRNERGSGDGIYRMEFPLMQWLVAAGYRIFGNHLALTRIFMFIIGLFTGAGIWKLLSALFRSDALAAAGAWAFTFSPSFYYYTINPIPDNLALCFALWGLALFFAWIRSRRNITLIFSGLFLALGALCKLPFILYFAAPLVFIFREAAVEKRSNAWVQLLSVLAWLVPPLAWYAWVIPQWDTYGIIAGMGGNALPFAVVFSYLWFNIVSTLPELLLNYASLPLFLAGLWFVVRRKVWRNPMFLPLAMTGLAVIAYFLYELNMIAGVHDYYLFPFLPLLFILVTFGFSRLVQIPGKYWRFFALFILAILPLTAWLRMRVRWNEDSPGFNRDLLTYKTELRAATPKDALCVAGNDGSHHIFFYYIDRKGWGFDNDSLPAGALQAMIGEGARFLYCDSRMVDENRELKPCLERLVAERGSVRVYSLKNPSDTLTKRPD